MQTLAAARRYANLKFLLLATAAACVAMEATAGEFQHGGTFLQPTVTLAGADTMGPNGVGLRLDAALSGLSEDCVEGGNTLTATKSLGSNYSPAAAAPIFSGSIPLMAKVDLTGERGGKQSRQTVAQAQRNVVPTLADRTVAAEQIAAVSNSAAWEIVPSDKTLNAALARWAGIAGWQLVWELPVDYAVETRTTVQGTFDEAVSIVAKSMESAEIPMRAIFYQGNKVIRIVTKGSE